MIYTFCFISNTLISYARLILAKTQANAKQHPRVETYILHPRYHPKIIVHILKNKQKKKYVCRNEDENEKIDSIDKT